MRMYNRRRRSPWEWFVEKVLPGLFIAMSMSIAGASAAIWQSIAKMSATITAHETELQGLRQEIQTIKSQMVIRTELLETLKRVEQQLQIAMLQAKLTGKIEVR